MKVVENAIIVPIFTMIIIALISVGIYMHDRIIIRNMVILMRQSNIYNK